MDVPAISYDMDFFCLPKSVQDEIRIWLNALSPVFRNEVPKRCAFYRELAEQMGTSVPTVRRKIADLRAKGWKGLINRAKVPVVEKAVNLSPEFVEYFKKLCEENQRCTAQAIKLLKSKWKYTDEPIPGYETPPPADELTGWPKGWTDGNLARYAPTKFELVVARQGRSAAADLRPLVLSSRIGLEVGQYYMFDDLEHDLQVNSIGVNRQAMRPLELYALDVFSGCKVAYGLKPTIIGDDGAKQKLKGRDMRFLLAYLLTQKGYRKDGTNLVVEHGTAAIAKDIENVLFEATAGAIKVERSGIEGAPALCGWYEGRGKGNFRFKSNLESLNNLLHNATAMLPGQMGKNRDSSPEELHGRTKENNKLLLMALGKLTPEQIKTLRFPFLSFQKFHEIYDVITTAINGRQDHHLEGWEQAGLVEHEFRLMTTAKQWLPMSYLDKLAPAQRETVFALAQRPGHGRIRKMSPLEVWVSRSRSLVKLPLYVVPSILGEDLAMPLRVADNGIISFQDKEIGPGTFRYLARAVRMDGERLHLKEGDEYQCFCNPFNVNQLLVCNLKGVFLGVCNQIVATRRDDVEGIQRAMGAAAHEEAVRLAEYRARHEPAIAQLREDRRHNAAVFAGAPVTLEALDREDGIDDARISKGDMAAALGGRNEEDVGVVSDEEIAALMER